MSCRPSQGARRISLPIAAPIPHPLSYARRDSAPCAYARRMCSPGVHIIATYPKPSCVCCSASICSPVRSVFTSYARRCPPFETICTPSGVVRRAYARQSPRHSEGESYVCRQCRIRRSRPYARRAAPFGVHMLAHVTSMSLCTAGIVVTLGEALNRGSFGTHSNLPQP